MSTYVGMRPDPRAAPQSIAAPGYAPMTKAQLAALLRERGVSVPSRAHKSQLIALLEAS